MEKKSSFKEIHKKYEFACGLDEVGRGCLAGPVVAAAVIFPKNFTHSEITDSKKLNATQRKELSQLIQKKAIAYSVAEISVEEIDTINILQASIKAMHKAVDMLSQKPDFLWVDGNKFHPYQKIPHQCVIKGDSKILAIGAASILAKVNRDELMQKLHLDFPEYDWNKNKGYPTPFHKKAIIKHGITPWHRTSFKLFPTQYTLDLE